MLASIRAVCIKANPSEFKCNDLRLTHVEANCPANRPIHLADVLLAISGKSYRPEAALKNRYHITANGIFVDYLARPTNTGVFWDLRRDSLTKQSDYCVSFLYELLK